MIQKEKSSERSLMESTVLFEYTDFLKKLAEGLEGLQAF
jgi:hypothetical protein